jgi:uncharacterized membrane protein YfcA
MAWGEFLAFVGVGLLAQLVDGALGMAYGLVSSSVLLSLGLPPVVASASVHTAEIATTAASGAAHAWFGNVERKLLLQLALPGVLGGVLGAFFLANIPPARSRRSSMATSSFSASWCWHAPADTHCCAAACGIPRHSASWPACSTQLAAAAGVQLRRPP